MVWSYPQEGRFYVVLAAGLVCLLFLAFRFASAPTARSKVLVTLRAGAMGVVVLILLDPVRIEQLKRAGPAPTAVFLIDGSRSMSLEAPVSRARAVDDLIRRSDALLSADRKPRIQKYGFGRELLALSGSENVMRSVADETRLGQALEQLPSRFGDTLPFGVFVFSDGRSTESDSRSSRPDRAGVPISGRANPCDTGGRRPDFWRRGRARHRCSALGPARHARTGSSYPAQPRLRRPAHRDLHWRGRRFQGRSTGNPARHPR